MADQVQPLTNGVHEKVEDARSVALSTLDSWTGQIQQWAQDLLDKFVSPGQRAAILARLQEFMLANPKLSAFLGMNIALTGPALFLFTVFGLSFATFALIVGVLVGLGAAALFSLFCIGTALVLVFPVIFFTTMAACFFFLWGLGGYYLIKWLNGTTDAEGEEGEGVPLLSSGSIAESLNSLTGGRLTGFMQSAKAEKAKGDISGFSDEHTPPSPEKKKVGSSHMKIDWSGQSSVNASKAQKTPPKAQQQNIGPGVSAPNPTASVQKTTKAIGVEGKVKSATNATGMVKGGISGATGLG